MFGFSCFQGPVHSEKHKKSARLPGETMHTTRQKTSSGGRVLQNFSFSATKKLPGLNEEEDSHYSADHVTDSSPTERECRSEELEKNINPEVHNNAPIRKSQSLGSGLNWVERTSGVDGSDESIGKKETELSNSGLEQQDQFQDPVPVPSDSIRVNSDCEKYMSIFSVGDPLQFEEEHTHHHQGGFCLSGDAKSGCGTTPHAQPPITKSNSVPNMASNSKHSPSFMQSSRSMEDLGKRKNMSHRYAREVQYEERFDAIINDDQNHEENLADDAYDEYVGLSKDWIVPAENGEKNGEKVVDGEPSMYHHADEVETPKDFKLKRIEDWVADLEHCSPLEVSEDFDKFYVSESSNSKGKAVMEDPVVIKTEAKIDTGTEAAKNYISSLNASATSAQLTNLGLVTIPFFSAFVSIKSLNLSGNAIVRITAGALPRGLHVLNLSRNSISTIEGLRELTRLRVLDLSYNRIVRIGHGLSSCSSLKELYLAGNKISEVEGLHRLLKLNVLDLRFNKISTTKCLGQLAANYNCLQALSLEGNPASKNVGDEPLKKYVQSLLPNLAYYNRLPVKTGLTTAAIKKEPSSDRSTRFKKGSYGGAVAGQKASASSSSVHGRKGHLTGSQKPSRGRHGARVPPPPPSGMRLSGADYYAGRAVVDLRNDFLMPRSRSVGNLGAI